MTQSRENLQSKLSDKIFGYGEFINNSGYIESRHAPSRSYLKKATKKVDISKLSETQSLVLLQMMRQEQQSPRSSLKGIYVN